ncbi:MAG: helix-turn-helix transcriptional regulator [Eubacteriales bacterium]|nr:helix-turn-helix transcriptional regulator [Eubacteriales bacterium]
MIEYEKIGKRILENRKYLRRVSQETMAEALGMYQADISNLEKAKKGSGITDLTKLDMIADYFGIPLENLIFGGNTNTMEKYFNKKVDFKKTKKMKTSHKKALGILTGQDMENMNALIYEWGPYVSYFLTEYQLSFGHDSQIINGEPQPDFVLQKIHTYVFFGNEVIAAFVTDVTIVMQHVFRPHMDKLREMIPFDILDITDAYRTLNPYWALWQFSEGNEEQEYMDLMVKRMDEIRACGQEDNILYIESGYVREDYRQIGIFHMYIDLLREIFGDCILWLNMEPTSGGELTTEYRYIPSYTVSELGQLSLNASIAERSGFTVDPDTWHRQSDIVKADGTTETKVILVRKCAYYLPEKWRNLLKDDGDLVAVGRAKQKIYYQNNTEDKTIADMKEGSDENYYIHEMKITHIAGPKIGESICIFAAYSKHDKSSLFGVTRKDLFDYGIKQENMLELYKYLDDALDSDYFDTMMMLNMLIQARLPWNKDETEK